MVRRFQSLFVRSWRIHDDQQGISYLGLLGMIMVIGAMLSVVGQQWSTTVKRDKEKELLFRGSRIQTAIAEFAVDYEVRKADRSNRFPRSLEELTQPPKRFLPKVYKDPITGKDFEMVLVKGEIRGVRSTSTESPMDIVKFKDAATYKDMVFQAQDAKGATGPDAASTANPLNPLNPFLNQPRPTDSSGSLGAAPNMPSPPSPNLGTNISPAAVPK